MALIRKIKDGETTIYPITVDQAVFVGKDGTTLDEALNNKVDKTTSYGGFAGGQGAVAATGGAVGLNASTNDRGGAVGQSAKTSIGGAVGYAASSSAGGAVGSNASAGEGGAIGLGASSEDGGAIGREASSTLGGAIGQEASAQSGGAIGQEASAQSGGAIGQNAASVSGGAVGQYASSAEGGAVGSGASSSLGGAVGRGATTQTGGAVGFKATSGGGGAVGSSASSVLGGAVGGSASADGGGAVGRMTKTGDGFAGGRSARTVTSADEPIDAIQLGTGTNSTAKTLQVYDYQLMDASGNIPQARLLNAFSGLVSSSSNKFNSSGADYAEYFEWADSNSNNEDRRGLFVTCIEDKIQLANPEDDIIGAISANPSIIGNAQEDTYKDKYEKDVFGAPIKDEDGNYKLNPNYDSSKEYIPYSERPEFGIVGLLGQLIVVDDGTCTVGGYCTSGNNGIGTKSDKGYKVLKRIDSNHIKILVK